MATGAYFTNLFYPVLLDARHVFPFFYWRAVGMCVGGNRSTGDFDQLEQKLIQLTLAGLCGKLYVLVLFELSLCTE